MNPTRQTQLELSYRLQGRLETRRFTTGGVTLGRDRSCDVVLADGSVSRRHARLDFHDGAWSITDTNSANGVAVRGQKVRDHRVADGDTIELGSVVIECRLSTPEPSASADPLAESTQGLTIQSCDVDDLLEDIYQDGRSMAEEHPGSCDLRPRPSGGEQRPAWILHLLREASEALMTHDDLESTLHVVMNLVFEHLPADRGQILLREDESDKLRTAVRRYRPEAKREGLDISRHIAREAIRSRRALLVRDTMEDGYDAVPSVVSNDIRSAMCAPLCHEQNVLGLIWLDRTSDPSVDASVFEKTHLEVLTILASLAAAAVERAQLRESIEEERRVRDRLSRYHAPAVVDEIVRMERLGEELDTSEREITVLFCDITKFTPLSEQLSPKDVIGVLNRVFQTLTEEVFREAGTLDKFLGDGMMVFFGAPMDQPDHAVRAVRAGLAMQRRLAELNATGTLSAPIGVRIGINTGPAIVGDVGADDRKDYTVIGDTVNVASRLESSVASTGEVVIGERTWELVKDRFACDALGEVNLKGKQRAIQAYRATDP